MAHWVHTQRRVVKTAAQNFIRNAWLSVAAMAVMVITLSIVLFSVVASATFKNTIDTFTEKIDISVFLVDEITDNQRNQLTADLDNIENVRDIHYVTKEEARQEFREDPKNTPESVEATYIIDDNPFPASLRIKTYDPNKLEEISAFLEKPDVKALQSEKTSYSDELKTAIDNIARTTSVMQRLGIVGIAAFSVVCMLIIFNTIQMAIFNRRDELTIMRLLGASTWFIRGPFIFETMYYGVASALISVALCHALFRVASSTFEATTLGLLDISYANAFFQRNFWLILTLQLAVGIFIGAASSFIATRRYLKFKTSK